MLNSKAKDSGMKGEWRRFETLETSTEAVVLPISYNIAAINKMKF